jgi:hypothetical protein
MKMLNVRFNIRELTRMTNNAVKYGKGFNDGIEMEKIFFMTELGKYAAESLNKYVDAKARGNPNALHHVYEWGQVGNPAGRLFEIEPIPGPNVIRFSGRFLASESVSDTATTPFIYKAETMENGITIVVAPHFAEYLKFEVNDTLVFTKNAITIEHPGGDAVAGSFGRVVDSFFTTYFTNSLLQPFLKNLAIAHGFKQNFPQGVRSGGYSIGVKAGRIYLRSAGANII